MPMFPDVWRRFSEEGSLRVEEFAEDGEFVVKADIPGLDPDKDVDIHISQGACTSGPSGRQESKTEKKG